MQVAISSAGEPDSYALLLRLKYSDNGRSVRHFVCCECKDLVEVAQGWDYLHTCGDGDFAQMMSVRAGIQRSRSIEESTIAQRTAKNTQGTLHERLGNTRQLVWGT